MKKCKVVAYPYFENFHTSPIFISLCHPTYKWDAHFQSKKCLGSILKQHSKLFKIWNTHFSIFIITNKLLVAIFDDVVNYYLQKNWWMQNDY
jgi:hypothetical protein